MKIKEVADYAFSLLVATLVAIGIIVVCLSA